MAQRDAPFRLRSLVLPVYLPTFLFAVGQGAVIPIIPLLAKDLGASVAIAATIVAVRNFGLLAFDIPAGWLVTKVGERTSMVLATLVLAVVALGAALTPSLAAFGAFVTVMGAGWAVWLLARLSFVTDVAPVHQRGRALSLLGGSQRIGNFLGPAIGGYIGYEFGLGAAFYVQAVLAWLACLALFLVNRSAAGDSKPASHDGSAYRRFGRVVAEHRTVFLTAGLATTAIGVLRAARQAVIPLWGDSIGLDAAQVGLLFTIANALDMTLFYPVGTIMDRFGRKWAGVPCLLLMAAGLAAIPLTDSFVTLLLASLLSSLGNGFGSGIVMTLGADFSPPVGRGEFLGVWRLVGDLGTAGGPTLIGVISAAASLGVASVVSGGIGLLGALVLLFLVPEPLKRHREEERLRLNQANAPPADDLDVVGAG